MCQKYIGCGTCSKMYLYILLGFIFKSLDDNFFQFTSVSSNKEDNVFGSNLVISKHIFIQNIYKYISFILGGIIFLFIIKKNTKKQRTRSFLLTVGPSNGIIPSLPTLLEYREDPIQKPILEIIIVSILYVLYFETLDIIGTFKISNLSFWTLELLFSIIFMKKYFVIKFYNFQKCSLIFLFSTVTALLIVALNLPVKHKDSEHLKGYNILLFLINNKYGFFIFALILINSNSLFISYGRVKAKVLMDYKYIYPYTLIIFMGVFGIIITSIELIICTSYECGEKNQDFCMVNPSNNLKIKYFDNVIIYFSDLKEKEISKLLIELLILLPIFLIINFFESVFELLVIANLNPLFVLIKNDCAYGINYLIYAILNYNNDNQEEILSQFFVTESAEIIAAICSLIYLEIIEIKLCGCDTYLTRNLILLSNIEAQLDEEMELDEDLDKDTIYSLKENEIIN